MSKKDEKSENVILTKETEARKRKLAEVSMEYRKMARTFANIIAQTDVLRRKCEYLSEKMSDNADPVSDLNESLIHMGNALSSLVTYAEEYNDESEGKVEDD